MINKIIYIFYLPLTEKYERDFYLQNLLDMNYSVEYWDLTEIFFPGIEFVGAVERNYIKKIQNYSELEEMISAQDFKKSFYVISMHVRWVVNKVYRILTKYNCYLIFFARGGLPTFGDNDLSLRRVVNNLRNYLRTDRIKQKMLYEIPIIYKKIGVIKNYDLVFTAGSVEESRYNGISKIIPINHFDYDNYLGFRDNPARIINNEYCVFLDDNLVYDTDYKILNIKTIEPTSYFTSLRTFFDHLKKKINLDVVIAAHPKTKYQGTEFGNREIIKGKTNELVKYCRFAIAHYSTSVSYAILYKKPIVFIYTNEMKDLLYFKSIAGFAQLLNANICNIDSRTLKYDINWTNIYSIDDSKYEDYKYKYLTSKPTENELSCNVFLQSMNKLINPL